MKKRFFVSSENPEARDSVVLLGELSARLAEMTGDSGEGSFDIADVSGPRSLFAVARDANGNAVGCGAVRPYTDEIAELKRMYSKASGAGTAVLEFLTQRAMTLNYKHLWLETRRVNEYAVNFYLKRGFAPIPNYGKYIGRSDAVCLGKPLNKQIWENNFN